MKQFVGYLMIFSLIASPAAFAHDACNETGCPHPKESDAYYLDEEDDEFFNKGRIVGEDNGEHLRAFKRRRNTNWALAVGTTAVGIATLVLVGKNQ